MKVTIQDARIFVPPNFSTAGKCRNPRLEIVPAPRRLHENVFSTGELDGIEQSLRVVTEKGSSTCDWVLPPGGASYSR